tara:strand:- start:2698 stop:3558 length:861 start_codon:yes stop_codon:yes gene_type:complete
MDIIELIIDEDNKELAIDAVSLVEFPAIESNWIFMSKDKNKLSLAKLDEHKRLIIGAALIPNKLIYRRDAEGKEYQVYFSESTIKEASELYLKSNNQSATTYEHKEGVEDITAVESWIVVDKKMDKSNLYGLNLPKGSWVLSMKVDNDKVWNDILAKKVKGFSIEGYFLDKMAALSKPVDTDTDTEILAALSDILKLSFVNYPKGASQSSERALIDNQNNGNKATATSVEIGRILATQEPISLNRIRKIYGYLKSTKKSSNSIPFRLYGGEVMLRWCSKMIENTIK